MEHERPFDSISLMGPYETPWAPSMAPMRCRPAHYHAWQSSGQNTYGEYDDYNLTSRAAQSRSSLGNRSEEEEKENNSSNYNYNAGHDNAIERSDSGFDALFWGNALLDDYSFETQPPTSHGDDQSVDYNDTSSQLFHQLAPSESIGQVAAAVQTSSSSSTAAAAAVPALVVVEDGQSHSRRKGRPLGMTNKKRGEVRGGGVAFRNKVKDTQTRDYLRTIHENCKQRGIKSPPKEELESILRECKLTKNEVLTFLAGMRFRERRDRDKPKRQKRSQ